MQTCDVTSPSVAAEVSARESILALIQGVRGNDDFLRTYDIKKMILAKCSARAMGQAVKAMELSQRYTNQAVLCSLDDLMQRGRPDDRAAREQTKQWFLHNYPSYVRMHASDFCWLSVTLNSIKCINVHLVSLHLSEFEPV